MRTTDHLTTDLRESTLTAARNSDNLFWRKDADGTPMAYRVRMFENTVHVATRYADNITEAGFLIEDWEVRGLD